MITNSLFSTYKKEEDQVTSTILAVLARLESATVSEFFRRLLNETSLPDLVSFENQFSKEASSRPDGSVKGSSHIIIETKIVEGGDDENFLKELKKQLQAHEEELRKYYDVENYAKKQGFESFGFYKKLLVLTPDKKEYNPLKKMDDIPSKISKKDVSWRNFEDVSNTLDDLIQDSDFILGQRSELLMKELISFIHSKDLLPFDPSQQVLMVPAGNAWQDYDNFSAYCCQPNRSFRSSGYLAFYNDNLVRKEIPKILAVIESFHLSEENISSIERSDFSYIDDDALSYYNKPVIENLKERLGKVRKNFYQEDHGGYNKILLLTGVNDSLTIDLDQEVENDKRSKGKGVAFVQQQRYFNINDFFYSNGNSIKKTSELE